MIDLVLKFHDDGTLLLADTTKVERLRNDYKIL